MGIPAGTSVGLYHVISQLGAGGMSEVYRARDPRAVARITEGRDTLDYVYAETLLETLGELKQPAASTEPGARHQASGTGTF